MKEEHEEWSRRVTTRWLQHRYLAALWYWGLLACVRFDGWARAHTHLPPWVALAFSLTALAVSVWSACR